VAAAEAQGRIEVAPGVTANWAEFTVPELPPGRQPLLLETDGASSSTLYISVR
jgi:hypothetical protein